MFLGAVYLNHFIILPCVSVLLAYAKEYDFTKPVRPLCRTIEVSLEDNCTSLVCHCLLISRITIQQAPHHCTMHVNIDTDPLCGALSLTVSRCNNHQPAESDQAIR